ncbi:hypothetical protein GOP47_0028391 [Adiantum capillus-veneris]|nr:hypothetical protein GOP47_0028391 [Adiantum capillus-veneris]
MQELISLFKASAAGARIVNISSDYGKLEKLGNAVLRQEIGDVETLTEEKIDRFVEKYLEDVKEGRIIGAGWPPSTYSVSKIASNAYTRVLARSLEERPEGQRIYVNCVSPGYCKTDMTSNQGFYAAEHGAETPVWFALLPANGPTGQFFG